MEPIKKRGRPPGPVSLDYKRIAAPFSAWPISQVRSWSLAQYQQFRAAVPDVTKAAVIRWLIAAGCTDQQIFQFTRHRLAKIAQMRRQIAAKLQPS